MQHKRQRRFLWVAMRSLLMSQIHVYHCNTNHPNESITRAIIYLCSRIPESSEPGLAYCKITTDWRVLLRSTTERSKQYVFELVCRRRFGVLPMIHMHKGKWHWPSWEKNTMMAAEMRVDRTYWHIFRACWGGKFLVRRGAFVCVFKYRCQGGDVQQSRAHEPQQESDSVSPHNLGLTVWLTLSFITDDKYHDSKYKKKKKTNLKKRGEQFQYRIMR